MMKRAISLWLPRFATDRLSRSNACAPHPEPAPLATVTAIHGGQRLVAVNTAAEAHGLFPGQPLADARALCPSVHIHPAEPAADLAALDRLCAACERYTPWAAIDPLGGLGGGGAGLWLDVTGCAHLFGGEEALLVDIVTRLEHAGYRARAALAATPGTAWALARFGGAETMRVAPGEDRARLAPLPLAALRLDPGLVEGLDRMGLRYVGDLMHLPRAPLAKRFGRTVLDRLDQALGELEEPISPHRVPPRHQARRVFAEPIGRAEDIEAGVSLLLADLCADLDSHGRGARRLDLVLHRVDNTYVHIEIGVSRPSRAPDHLQRLFRDKLEGLDPGFGIEVMMLAACETALMPAEQAVLAATGNEAIAARDGAARLVDRLAGRLGGANVTRFVATASHQPERACREQPLLGPRRKASEGEKVSWSGSAHRTARPVRLLGQPMPIDVIAPVPDGPPMVFRWRKRQHKVVNAEGPERIAPEWWRSEGRPPSPEARDYYRVEDEDGRRFWVFREGLYRPDRVPGWYLHGFFA